MSVKWSSPRLFSRWNRFRVYRKDRVKEKDADTIVAFRSAKGSPFAEQKGLSNS